MSTQFSSVKEAQEYVAVAAGRNPEEVEFEEVEGLQAAGMEIMLLNDPGTSERTKREIEDRMASQQGFKFVNSEGKEVQIVIGPFRNGYECWVVLENGLTVRL